MPTAPAQDEREVIVKEVTMTMGTWSMIDTESLRLLNEDHRARLAADWGRRSGRRSGPVAGRRSLRTWLRRDGAGLDAGTRAGTSASQASVPAPRKELTGSRR
jgi:hypothetical protein